jgi:TolA-binding protein
MRMKRPTTNTRLETARRRAAGRRTGLGPSLGGLVLAGWLIAGCGSLAGAEAPPRANDERQDWDVAARFFQGTAYDLAEQGFLAFIQKHPGSDKVGEAVLLLVEARFRQGRYEAALAALREHMDRAGGLADEYHFWMAESLLRLQRLDEAVAEFVRVGSEFPGSARALEAAVGQALALQQSGKPRDAFDLLSQPDGVFLRLGTGREREAAVVRGYLILGETALACGQAAAGEALLERLPADLEPGWSAWRRGYLLARLRVALGKTNEALTTVTNLITELGGRTNAAAVQMRADATALAAQALEKRGDSEGAMVMFESNLVHGLAPLRRQEAAEQLARLALERAGPEAMVARLQGILSRHPADPVVAPLRVALAELELRRYFAAPPDQRAGAAASLQQARQHARAALTNAAGVWFSRAHFALGWCAWESSGLGTGEDRREEAAVSFEQAATGLPRSVEQAVARFKAGDSRYALTNYPAAARHYWLAATNYTEFPAVRQGFADHALYQIVRVSLAQEDLEGASRAMRLVLEWYPQSYFGDRSLLWFGQALGAAGRPAEARRLFSEFLRKFPTSPLVPELGLALARTWQHEGNWEAAAAEYERWMKAHAEHPSRGQAAYEQAWSMHRSGQEGLAFQQFTNFVAQFPRHALAPSALHWVADHHYRRGRFDLAESEYQRVYQNTNWPVTDLTYHARMMAGRSAYRRTSYREARGYFTELINSLGTNAPAGMLPEAYFLLGDTIRAGADADRLLTSLAEAIVAYSKIPQNHPESSLVPLAWGEIGNCHFQLGMADAKQYDLAMAAYTNVLQSAQADVAARSQAEAGLAMSLERKAALPTATDRSALLTAALGHYLRITEGGNLREGEVADRFWVERAGSAAAQLAEQLQRWDVAEALYRRLLDLAPPLAAKYQARWDRLRQARAATGGVGP